MEIQIFQKLKYKYFKNGIIFKSFFRETLKLKKINLQNSGFSKINKIQIVDFVENCLFCLS